jgi:hypothetical protein
MEYRIQRPSTVWVETTVEADDLEQALELADENFENGEFEELGDTLEVNYDRFWSKDENDEVREGTETYQLAYKENA